MQRLEGDSLTELLIHHFEDLTMATMTEESNDLVTFGDPITIDEDVSRPAHGRVCCSVPTSKTIEDLHRDFACAMGRPEGGFLRRGTRRSIPSLGGQKASAVALE